MISGDSSIEVFLNRSTTASSTTFLISVFSSPQNNLVFAKFRRNKSI